MRDFTSVTEQLFHATTISIKRDEIKASLYHVPFTGSFRNSARIVHSTTIIGKLNESVPGFRRSLPGSSPMVGERGTDRSRLDGPDRCKSNINEGKRRAFIILSGVFDVVGFAPCVQ